MIECAILGCGVWKVFSKKVTSSQNWIKMRW